MNFCRLLTITSIYWFQERIFYQKRKRDIGGRGTDERKTVPFEMLLKLSPENLNDAVKGEHPQTIALILSYLPESNAADVLKLLPEDVKVEVAYRLTDLGDVSTEFIDELDQTMKNSLASTGTSSVNLMVSRHWHQF